MVILLPFPHTPSASVTHLPLSLSINSLHCLSPLPFFSLSFTPPVRSIDIYIYILTISWAHAARALSFPNRDHLMDDNDVASALASAFSKNYESNYEPPLLVERNRRKTTSGNAHMITAAIPLPSPLLLPPLPPPPLPPLLPRPLPPPPFAAVGVDRGHTPPPPPRAPPPIPDSPTTRRGELAGSARL